MASKLFVGNLDYDTPESDIEELFAEYGTVESVNLITDNATGRSKGFAFVEMSSEEEAQEAIDALDGNDVDGRELRVEEAKPENE